MKALLPFVLAGLLLSACGSAAVPEPTPPPAPDGADSERSAFDIGCTDVAPWGELVELWGDDIALQPFPTVSAIGSWEMQGTGLLQDGALACTWGTSPTIRPGLVVLALADARDGFERSEASFTDGDFPYATAYVADSSMTLCRSDNAEAGIQCHWNVLAGDTWLSFFFQHLPDSEITSSGEAYRDGVAGAIVAAVVENVAAALTTPIPQPDATIAPCDERVTPELLAGILGVDPETVAVQSGRPVEDSLGRSTPLFGQVLWAYAYERQGYAECAYITQTSTRGTIMTAPGAAWVLEHPGAEQPELVDIEGFGQGIDTCRTEAGYTLCTRAVAVGGDLVMVQLEDDGTGVAATWAADLVNALISP